MPENYQQFIDAFCDETQLNPFVRWERIYEQQACIAIQYEDGTIKLNMIRSLVRSAGHGSLALIWLCGLADKHNIVLTGMVQPATKVKTLKRHQLKQWYKRHGFTVTRDDHMRREPNA